MNNLENRIKKIPAERTLTVSTTLLHFSIVTYLVEYDKLRKVIPAQFDLHTIRKDGKEYGMVSAVTFVDKDFRFNKICPFLTWTFPQTNYRAYVTYKSSNEKCAWFFGTGLGSRWVAIPRFLCKMPWFYSKYKTKFSFNNGLYKEYNIEVSAKNADAKIDIIEDGISNFDTSDFPNRAEAELILLYPVSGFFARADQQIGKYKIWHGKMNIKTGKCRDTYFQKFEKLGLLTKDEVKK